MLFRVKKLARLRAFVLCVRRAVSEIGGASRNFVHIAPIYETNTRNILHIFRYLPTFHHEASRYWPCCAHSPQCSLCYRPFNSQSSSSMVQCSPRAGGPSARSPRRTWGRGTTTREHEESYSAEEGWLPISNPSSVAEPSPFSDTVRAVPD
jgi:hypothetical protein